MFVDEKSKLGTERFFPFVITFLFRLFFRNYKKMLTINEYQKEAHKTACYLGLENGDYRYPVMGLADIFFVDRKNGFGIVCGEVDIQ